MWRYFVMAGAALLLLLGGVFLFRSPATSAAKAVVLPAAPAAVRDEPETALPPEAPRASARTREEKRFDRYDKDRNDSITREEYLLARRKAFAKLDRNGNGSLDFEEWAVRTTGKFGGADKDRSGALTRVEFATTAPKPRAAAAKPKCVCPPPAAADAED